MTAYTFSRLVPDSSYGAVCEPNNFVSSWVEFQYDLNGVAVANGDTISTPALGLPNSGIRVTEVEVHFPPLDTNATPTGTFNVGDSGLASRFILSASLGGANQVNRYINQAQALTSGVVTTGSNYLYDANSATYGTGTNGPILILAVNAVLATAATTGVIRMKVWFKPTSEY